MAGRTDFKPRARIRDKDLLRLLHVQGGVCALADDTCEELVTLHHIHRHPRDDVRANLIWLCGSGTTGHHGLITRNDRATCAALGAVLRVWRPDTIRYLSEKLGGDDAAREWLRRYL